LDDRPPTVPPPERPAPEPTSVLLVVPTKYPPQNYRLSFSLKDIQDLQTVQSTQAPPTTSDSTRSEIDSTRSDLDSTRSDIDSTRSDYHSARSDFNSARSDAAQIGVTGSVLPPSIDEPPLDVNAEGSKDAAKKRRMVSFREVQTMTSKLNQRASPLHSENRSISAAALLNGI